MGDEQGAAQAAPGTVTTVDAVDAELRRVIRIVEAGAATRVYPLGGRRATVYAVMRTALPDMIDRERWRHLAGVDPDITEDPVEVARQQAEREANYDQQRREDLALIRAMQPNYRECCEGCTTGLAAEYRRQGVAQPPLPDMPPVPPPVHQEPAPEPERTCECEACEGSDTDESLTCQGDCDRDDVDCYDTDCQVHRCDEASACCGYCSECETHHGDGDDERCNMGHCHECEHRCDDYD